MLERMRGELLLANEKYEEAVGLLEEAIAIRSQLMGENHPLTLAAIAQLERTHAADE